MMRCSFPAWRALRLAATSVLVVVPSTVRSQGLSNGASRAHGSSAGSLASAASKGAAGALEAGAPATITIEGGARRMLVGATVPHVVRVRDAAGAERRDVPVRWSSSDPNVASVNRFGVLTAVRPGPVTLRVAAGPLSAERRYTVEANPIRSLTLSITADQPRTGDVVEVSATAFDANGGKVPNVPFLYTFTAAVEDSAVGQLAPAELDQKGRFVAQKAGDYQIIAVAPGLVAHRTIRVSNRDVSEGSRILGRAPAPGALVADAFAWRGRDGRDYLLACGGSTPGQVVVSDISDASSPRAIDTVSVDARAVADCIVDAESGIAAVVREGVNGRGAISLFDATDPSSLKSRGSIDEGLGSISGVAQYKRHVLVVSDARRLDIVSVEDPARPRRVGSIDFAGDGSAAGVSSVVPTDVWVNDGMAYVALGQRGMVVVDVGNGKFGGTLAKPVRVGGFHMPFASTHAAYGFRSRTGKWYVVTSEDLTREGDAVRGAASTAPGRPGFARIIDFTDPAHPEEVARYEVPEAGVQDLWIEGERLYVAAQRGGARVVDVSADLKGNLYYQGREIARLLPADASTAPNVVAVQPHQGVVVVADRNGGVWLVKMGR